MFGIPVVGEATCSSSVDIVHVRESEHVLALHQHRPPLSVHSIPIKKNANHNDIVRYNI